ncbi:Uncharacterised protein [uncultured Clostridium sp.]|nr:Uncharacterised protein [uncultured Clostridium sp.]
MSESESSRKGTIDMLENNQRRLLDVKEFQAYAGGIGRNSALRLAGEAQVRVRIGRRLLIDREKFDKWIEENVQ